MKNDFEYFKYRFENSMPDVPKAISEKEIEKKILAKQEHKIINFDTKKSISKPLFSMVACFILILGITLSAGYGLFNSNKVSGFSDANEINNIMLTLEKAEPHERGCGEFFTKMVYNEPGVNEPQRIVSRNDDVFYSYYNHNRTTNRNKVFVISNGKHVSTIENFNHDDCEIEGMFLNKNILTVFLYNDSCYIVGYDVSNMKNPKKLYEFEQSGYNGKVRQIDDKLYIVSGYEVFDSKQIMPIVNGKELSPKDIYTFDDVKVAEYCVISSINVATGQQEATKAILGGSSNAHFTKDFIYINEYIKGELYFEPEREVEKAVKLNLKKYGLKYADKNEVEKYKSDLLNLNKEESYSSNVYQLDNFCLNIGENINTLAQDISLYDEEMKLIDSYQLNENLVISKNQIVFNNDRTKFAFPAYFSNPTYRANGAVVFEIKDGKVVLSNSFFSNDIDDCAFVGDSLYGFSVDDNADSQISVYSYELV